MSKRMIITDNIIYEIIASLGLSILFLGLGTLYFQNNNIVERLDTFFTKEESVLYVIPSAPKQSSTDIKENFIKSFKTEEFILSRMLRQVALLSIPSIETIPRKSIAYRSLKRFSSLHLAYVASSIPEYEYLEKYLLNLFNKTSIKKQYVAKNIQALKKYILQINPKVGYQYANNVARKIIATSDRFNIPYALLGGLIGTESTYNRVAISHVGATGLTQVYPKVWTKELIKQGIITKAEDLYNIDKNLEAGAYILSSYYSLGKKIAHKNPLRYALHRYYGARDNTYIERVYKHSNNIAEKANLLV